MKLCIIGSGYVGLVSGACFAEVGHHVICVDNDQRKVDKLLAGQIPIYEPGLEDLVHKNVAAKRLSFTTSTEEGVDGSEAVFIAVPTPPQPDGSVDLSYIEKVAREIAAVLKKGQYRVIVDKSTVPVKTGEKVSETIRRYNKTDAEFDVVSNPEFLREGCAVADLMKPDRIVIGGNSERAIALMQKIYEPFMAPVLVTDINSAELIKHAANSFLALKISYINAVAQICEASGADVEKVADGIGSDRRIGRNFLNAGIGYGGSCFPKDVQALHFTAAQNGYNFEILASVMDVNTRQKQRLTQKVQAFFGDNLSGKRFALWGIAFKPNTDDIREAPSLTVIQELNAAGATVVAFDPEAMASLRKYHPDLKVELADNPYDALKDADALLIVTEWNEFRTPEFQRIREGLKAPIIFDGRNLYEPFHLEEQGFYYESIGRPTVDGRDK